MYPTNRLTTEEKQARGQLFLALIKGMEGQQIKTHEEVAGYDEQPVIAFSYGTYSIAHVGIMSYGRYRDREFRIEIEYISHFPVIGSQTSSRMKWNPESCTARVPEILKKILDRFKALQGSLKCNEGNIQRAEQFAARWQGKLRQIQVKPRVVASEYSHEASLVMPWLHARSNGMIRQEPQCNDCSQPLFRLSLDLHNVSEETVVEVMKGLDLKIAVAGQ